jgi:sodium-dependent phosphate cotransporter
VRHRLPQILLRTFAVVGLLVLFFTSLEVMSEALRRMGSDFVEALLGTTSSPLLGLMIGILATAIVQSSSTITSLTVALVAGGALPIEEAVPLVMGANVGTTVTNTIVAMGHITRKDEFRQAMAGATVHDVFNISTAFLLFPLEYFFGAISQPASWLTSAVAGVGGTRIFSPLARVVEPTAQVLVGWMGGYDGVALAAGLVSLFAALRYLVVLLKSVTFGRAEQVLHRYLFGTAHASLACGLLLTFVLQSSSVTTSVIVPLVAAGLLNVRQIYPYTLGANVGTTVTALLAALSLAVPGTDASLAGLTVAFAHVLFNVFGAALTLAARPMRDAQIWMAEAIGTLSARNRVYAILYLLGVFYLVPILIALVL